MKRVSRSTRDIILSHTLTYFNMLNFALAGLVILSGQYKNMLFLGIVFSNSLIGIVQELKVKKLIDALSVLTADSARRIRDGKTEEVPMEELQIGDVIEVRPGDQIVADSTVLRSDGLEVNESLLTGESDAVIKRGGDSLFSGSFITAGTGTARIVHTGEDNYASQLVEKARTKKRASSEMQNAIKKIIRYVSYAIIPIGIALFLVQHFRVGENISNSLVNTVAGVLGMIPEGLVLLTSVSFILGVGRLAKKGALVQEMEAIEALARTNVLCLDKTGTITTGELSVRQVIPFGNNSKSETSELIHDIIFSFSDSNVTSDALRSYFIHGKNRTATEHIPFNSTRKFMGVTFGDQEHYVLGAPDFLCHDSAILAKAENYAKEGLRVLLAASCEKLGNSADELGNTEPVALLLLSDCIKKDAAKIFQYFSEQGVCVKIISGDNAATVSAVGRQAGVAGAENYINASELPDDIEQFRELIKKTTVFGRVSPEMKQRIIRAHQQNGDVVSIVGDGINDVLSLKDADCGIAMANGAPAAKQSAHIVLLDSDFSTMKNIVSEGRTIIANIERVSALYLTKTIYSMLLCLLFTLLGKTYPFIPIQLSLIGGTAIGIPSFLLALEQHEEVTGTGFLRHVLKHSLPAAILLVITLIVLQFTGTAFHWSDDMLRTCNLLAGGIISIGVVVRVCLPMTRRRLAICLLISALFAGAILLFPSIFDVLPVTQFL